MSALFHDNLAVLFFFVLYVISSMTETSICHINERNT